MSPQQIAPQPPATGASHLVIEEPAMAPAEAHAAKDATKTELADTETGAWQIVTETSTYLVDLDARTLTRYPGTGGGPVANLPAPSTSTFDDDAQALPLEGIHTCAVGRRALLLIGEGHSRTRATTIVHAIHPASLA